MIIETDIGTVSQDPIPTTIDTEVTAGMIQEEAIPSHTTDPHAVAHLDTKTNTHAATDVTQHTGDPHLTEDSPGITANQGLTQLINAIAKHQPDHPTAPNEQNGKQITEITNKSPLMTHHLSTTVPMSKTVTRRMI